MCGSAQLLYLMWGDDPATGIAPVSAKNPTLLAIAEDLLEQDGLLLELGARLA